MWHAVPQPPLSLALLLAIVLALGTCGSAPPDGPAATSSGQPLPDHDFVVAIPTCTTRLPLLDAGRVWRKSLRTFVTINSTEAARQLTASSGGRGEVYVYWDADAREHGTWRAYYTGDTRAGVTPLLAHEHFGATYKWMLYADDE